MVLGGWSPSGDYLSRRFEVVRLDVGADTNDGGSDAEFERFELFKGAIGVGYFFATPTITGDTYVERVIIADAARC